VVPVVLSHVGTGFPEGGLGGRLLVRWGSITRLGPPSTLRFGSRVAKWYWNGVHRTKPMRRYQCHAVLVRAPKDDYACRRQPSGPRTNRALSRLSISNGVTHLMPRPMHASGILILRVDAEGTSWVTIVCSPASE
jgi:hypothetical protein